MTPARRAHLVKEAARDLGFASCGITDLSPPPHAAALTRWLGEGMAGSMSYMGRQAARRLDPSRIVPGARRVVVLTRTYPGGEDPLPSDSVGEGRVARYARGRDYHDALAQPLQELAHHIAGLGGEETVVRWFVDAGPVPERELAQRAGLGWIGKNTMLIDPARGSYAFLASVFTDLDLAVDSPFEPDRCGSCRRCLDACPTGAFPEPRVLDARLCISYLTIEFRGEELPPSLAPHLAGWAFGCDICQEVCPWNVKFAREEEDPALERDESMGRLDLRRISAMSDAEFDACYGHTALNRPGADGLRRNARALLETPGD